ncbi:MAG TPA: hypothetical protein VGO93_31825 [Candidatus Xenobia bacterium]|jgi:hypothetical protein
MPNSSGAVRLGGTLYRISEVAWLKVQRLTLWEKLTNGLLVLSGLLFLSAMHTAKGQWMSLEGMLGLLPICLGLSIHGDARLGSSGDTQDSYFGRGLGLDVNIRELARPLRDSGSSFLELTGTGNAYYYLINTDRIAWVSSWFTANTWPLWMGMLFFGYNWVLGKGLHMPSLPAPVDNLKILEFPNGAGTLEAAAFFCGIAGVLSLASSVKFGVILGSVGGVADTLHMYKDDRHRLLEIVAGDDSDAPAVPVVRSTPAPAPAPAPPPSPPPAAPANPGPAATSAN